jgi:hypothetical protein
LEIISFAIKTNHLRPNPIWVSKNNPIPLKERERWKKATWFKGLSCLEILVPAGRKMDSKRAMR